MKIPAGTKYIIRRRCGTVYFYSKGEAPRKVKYTKTYWTAKHIDDNLIAYEATDKRNAPMIWRIK